MSYTLIHLFFLKKKNFNIAAVVLSVNAPVTGRNSPVPGLTGLTSRVYLDRH